MKRKVSIPSDRRAGRKGVVKSKRTPSRPSDGMVVPLSQNKNALISKKDQKIVCSRRWWVNNIRGRFYAIGWDKKRITMHGIIMNPPVGFFVDHKNGNGLDNRRENLRICTKSQNVQNTRKAAGKSSRFKGVCRDRGKWKSSIYVGGKIKSLGRFDKEKDAAIAYAVSARINFGEFARTNFHV